jgi:hypothetical protein
MGDFEASFFMPLGAKVALLPCSSRHVGPTPSRRAHQEQEAEKHEGPAQAPGINYILDGSGASGVFSASVVVAGLCGYRLTRSMLSMLSTPLSMKPLMVKTVSTATRLVRICRIQLQAMTTAVLMHKGPQVVPIRAFATEKLCKLPPCLRSTGERSFG